jgi:hypothetical protein
MSNGASSAQPSDLQTVPARNGVPATIGAPPVDSSFGYQGGPIIAQPQVYATFWGAAWANADHAQRRADLVQFIQDLLASDYMNILSQYGVGQGAGQGGTWMGDSGLATVQGQLSDSDIHANVQSLINAGTLPEPASPSNIALMIFLDESVDVNDAGLGVTMCAPQGDTAFGYHYFFTTAAGNQFYYAVVPALTDACLQESCQDDNSCSLHLAATQEQRQTQVASHEFSEMVTDPEITAWRDPNNGNENGDICNGKNGTITVGGRSWTVQRMYSLVDDSSGGQACILGAPNPIPSQLG